MLAEAWAVARSRLVPSLLVLVVVAATCFTSLATVGSQAAALAEVTARMEQAGARRLDVTDGTGQGFINMRTLASVRALDSVETAHVLGRPFDAVNGVLGQGSPSIPVWPTLDGVGSMVQIVQGRAPQPGEAIVSTTQLATLRLAVASGYVVSLDGQQNLAVVGAFEPMAGFEDLAAGALTGGGDELGFQLRVMVDDIAAAPATVRAIMSILAPADASAARVESPTALAQTARDLTAQLQQQGRSLLLMILAAGGFFVAVVVLADVLVNRRDLGRRRTLGITRTDLVVLVALRTALTAGLGAVVGVVAGLLARAVPIPFAIATGVLGLLIATAASIPPALYAALRDPVTVMRTP